jgi:2,3-bisphosphoglycerate-independent phosphoglycerate mutase
MALGKTMSDPWHLADHPEFSPVKGPLLFVVMDGVGVGPADEWDAVAKARTPTLDAMGQNARHFRTLKAHGRAVGLPSDGDMGNSEVGHNALGCGRIVLQGASLVDRALGSNSLFEGAGWQYLKERFGDGQGALHFIGLLSDGGVHSRQDQLEKILDGAAKDGARKIRMHILLDGRDVPDQSAHHFVQRLEDKLASLQKMGVDAKIASGGGRMFVTMDRYEADWTIVERGWKAHVLGQAEAFPSAQAAIEAFRNRVAGQSDQHLPPFVVEENGAPVGRIQDGDAVCMFNFRGDRAIEITRAFEAETFTAFDRQRKVDVHYAGLMEYDGDLHIPAHYLVEPPTIERTSGEYLVHNGLRTFACSETQKYGHVTYFWNGNRSGTFDEALERYHEVPSNPPPFDQKPEMRAEAIAEAACQALRSKQYDQVRVNLANGDMVGHTGNLSATIQAVEAVDAALAQMLDCLHEVEGSFLVTADHGNADDMAQRNKDGSPKRNQDNRVLPKTSHTLSPVPVFVGGPGLPEGIRFREDQPEAGLANLTATMLNLMGKKAPTEWEPSLLKKN